MLKKAVCLCIVFCVGGPALCADPDMIGWWKLDEGSGATVVDSSGNGNDGTIINPNGGQGPGPRFAARGLQLLLLKRKAPGLELPVNLFAEHDVAVFHVRRRDHDGQVHGPGPSASGL